jgi:hypothetical protein
MSIRPIILAVLALVALAVPASARQLAVGAASGYFEPPGYKAVPVYTWPRGPAWTPVDTSFGRPFREPLYATPRGYKYVYVRGYYWKRLPNPYAVRSYRRRHHGHARPPRSLRHRYRLRPLRDVPKLALSAGRQPGRHTS